MTSDDHRYGYLSSLRTESVSATPRDENELKPQVNLRVQLGNKFSSFYPQANREYALMHGASPNTGRSIASNCEVSEAINLHEGSGLVDIKRRGIAFCSDTEELSPTHRKRKGNDDEDDDFTFREEDKKDGSDKKLEIEAGILKNQNTQETKKKKKREAIHKQLTKEENDIVANQDKQPTGKLKKEKTAHFGQIDINRTEKEISKLENMQEDAEKTNETTAITKKKSKKKKPKKTISEKIPKELKEVEIASQVPIVLKHHNLSISGHSETPQALMTENGSFISSPQSTTAMKHETCPSPLLLTSKITQSPLIPPKKTDKKKYQVDQNTDQKPKKSKEKKLKHQHHYQHTSKPKKVLLTDGLNLVKLLTDRTNCKKTKLLIVLFTFTVLWSIVLNGLELTFFADTKCRVFTELGSTYIAFLIMLLSKLFSVTLFNLEITFKQPYKLSTALLYPFAAQCFSPLLQLPQNIYDFSGCQPTNYIIEVDKSWYFLHAIFGSIGGVSLYFIIKQSIDIELIRSRLGRLISKLFRCLVIIAIIAWNLILITVFIAQKELFLPSFFFDFYLYLILLISTTTLYTLKRMLGAEKLKALLVKEETKKLAEPLAQSPQQNIEIEIQP